MINVSKPPPIYNSLTSSKEFVKPNWRIELQIADYETAVLPLALIGRIDPQGVEPCFKPDISRRRNYRPAEVLGRESEDSL